MTAIGVVGAAAVWDYLLYVDTLPDKGGIVKVLRDCPEPVPGGCAPSIARGIQKLCGCGPRLYYPVGDDAENALLEWQKDGIDIQYVQKAEDVRSGYVWQFMQGDGSTMCFAYPGAADTTKPILPAMLEDTVVIAPVLNQFTVPFLEQAIAQKRRVVMTGICDAGIVPYLKDIQVLILNMHEADRLYRHLGKSSLAGLSDFPGPANVFVTCGKKGSLLLNGNSVYEIPIIQEDNFVDATGAGDAYTAGVVFGLENGFKPVDAAYVGSCCSSFVVEGFGGQCSLPDWNSVKRRLKEQVPGIMQNIT
jgi:sugar/nucleoside kinase (ribokinase family)